jgi:Immunity protein 63
MDQLERIQSGFELIRDQLNLKKGDRCYMEFTTSPRGDGTPHIEICDGNLHFVVSERGTEYKRRVTQNEDELLYWLVCCLTREMASQWELRNRIPDTDTRIGWMKKEIEILNSINAEWAVRKRIEYKWVLDRVSRSNPQ